MRLAACALSAVLLSGCSWLGLGGHSNGYGTSGGAYGAGCVPGQTASYGQFGQHGQTASYGGGYGMDPACAGGAYGVGQGYGAGYGAGQGYGSGYGAGGQGYGQAGAGYGAYGQGAGGASGFGPGAAGYGQGGFGPGAAGYGQGGYGQAGFGQAGYGQAGYGTGGIGAGLAAQGIGGQYGQYGANTVYSGGTTTLGTGAPYGGNVVGTQLNNGQYVNGAYVQNVVGAPIYVPQPYPQPYGVPQIRGVGAALPFGFEIFGGTEIGIDGDLVSAKEEGPALGGGGRAGAFDAISYSDAFTDGYYIGGEGSYDLSRNTTLLASAAYSKKEGRIVDTGSFQPGTYDPGTGVFTHNAGSSSPRDLSGKFTNLEEVTLEGGIRRYVGHNLGFRPYVGASAGFAYNNDVTLTQTYDDDGSVFNKQQFIDDGWRPTAAGVVGAEMAVGHRGSIGVETGLRWRDNLKAVTGGDDRLSIPVKLRGRLAF